MSITSAVDICNLAGSLLNIPPITSITDPLTSEEEVFALWYDQVRREALRRHSWNFAMKRTILASSSAAPPFGVSKAFPLPQDYIRLSEVGSPPLQAEDYVIESAADGGLIIGINGSNGGSTDTLRLVYVSDVEAVPLMDASFIDYFIHLLAQKISYNITQKNSAVERTDALMEKAEARARAIDGQENPPKRIERSRALRARRNGGFLGGSNRNNHLIGGGGNG